MSDIIYYPESPYKATQKAQTATMYQPKPYPLSLLLVRINPVALRVLFYALANVQSDGSVTLSPKPLAKAMQTQSHYVSKGIRELIKYNFIARKTRVVMWLSPDVAQPITITR